ncbi:MAG: DUF58 domain-containing protein [Myxococcales bacterium]|nr:DUF58 domain-containing protein [Myxococcales bacterium]MCB9644589.1 DUF58 domain-containing protein [Myxococcales bacterium]
MRRTSFIDPQLLAKLPPVALKALRDVEGALTGLHQSPHHGQSIEFTEHKEYSPGDEIRHVDWKLYAKSDRYYVKQFEDETNLRTYILLDASASMNYPQHPADLEKRPTKYQYAASLSLALAYLLLRQRDSAGLLTFNEKLQTYLPPKSQPSYLLPIAQAVEQQAPAGDTALPQTLRRLAEIARRRSLIILISDLFTDTETLESLLKQLSHRGHDVVMFHVLDPDELDFPFRDQTLFEDLEDAQSRLQIDAQAIRPYYLQELQQYLEKVEKIAKRSGITYRQVRTDTPMLQVITNFILRRARARKRS